MTLDQLNQLDQAAFTEVLGAIFEHSPWVAERTWPQRPFASLDALHTALCDSLAAADDHARLALIRAHPRLAGKAAIAGELTLSSRQEQRGAGLDQCTAEEFALLNELNTQYDARFGFPFILAVRGHDRHSIIANMQVRITRAPEVERAEALRQIERIAAFRLADTIDTIARS